MAAGALLLAGGGGSTCARAGRAHRDVLAARGLVWAARTDGLAVLDLADPPRPQVGGPLS
jgi:hypothetical protein